MNPSRLERFDHRDRNGRGRGIAVFLDIQCNLGHGNREVLCQGLDDPPVGLVRDDQINILIFQAKVAQNLANFDCHALDRTAENFTAVKIDIEYVIVVNETVSRGAEVWNFQRFQCFTFTTQVGSQQAGFLFTGFEYKCAGAITKQHGGVT